jgi:hypothetical protein
MARLRINKSGNARLNRVQTYMKAYLSLHGNDETIELSDLGTKQSAKAIFADESALFLALDRHEFAIRARTGLPGSQIILSRKVDLDASVITVASQLKSLRNCAFQIGGALQVIKLAFPKGTHAGFKFISHPHDHGTSARRWIIRNVNTPNNSNLIEIIYCYEKNFIPHFIAYRKIITAYNKTLSDDIPVAVKNGYEIEGLKSLKILYNGTNPYEAIEAFAHLK